MYKTNRQLKTPIILFARIFLLKARQGTPPPQNGSTLLTFLIGFSENTYSLGGVPSGPRTLLGFQSAKPKHLKGKKTIGAFETSTSNRLPSG